MGLSFFLVTPRPLADRQWLRLRKKLGQHHRSLTHWLNRENKVIKKSYRLFITRRSFRALLISSTLRSQGKHYFFEGFYMINLYDQVHSSTRWRTSSAMADASEQRFNNAPSDRVFRNFLITEWQRMTRAPTGAPVFAVRSGNVISVRTRKFLLIKYLDTRFTAIGQLRGLFSSYVSIRRINYTTDW